MKPRDPIAQPAVEIRADTDGQAWIYKSGSKFLRLGPSAQVVALWDRWAAEKMTPPRELIISE